MSAPALTDDQFAAIVIIERVNSSLSILGCAFIIVTFLSSRAFHKPINRLVFFASVGNIMTNFATLIGRSAISNPNGALCQLQGFLIQMFMCADGFWTFAMACNVYLTFFFKYDADRLRTMEKWYFLGCYGIPFIPALVYVWVFDHEGNRVYGDATLWCWVSNDFDIIRIVTFYAPVWVAIFLTIIIYSRAGREIYVKRKQLLSFTRQQPSTPMVPLPESAHSTKTTEVHVTSESIEDTEVPIDLARLGRRPTPADRPLYSVKISSQQARRDLESPLPTPKSETKSIPALPPSEQPQPIRPYVAMEANNAAWSYTKVALLFFTAMLVTWIPSTANRVYSLANHGDISPPLVFASAFVLPLQGFWNALIYITTSWHACRKFFGGSARYSKNNPVVSPRKTVSYVTKSWNASHAFSGNAARSFRERIDRAQPISFSIRGRADHLVAGDKSSETESTAELASRPTSKMSSQ